MMCTAKAITNGYFPFGAVMLNEKIADVFENDKSGGAAIGSGYTYSGHPVGAAAAIACIEETKRLAVHKNAAARGAELYAGLQDLATKHEIIGDVRGGHGLMCAMELVGDRKTKSAPDKAKVGHIYQATYDHGVIVRISGPNIILSPPLVITSAEIAKIISALDAGMTEMREKAGHG
jgi:adenosylmethionine-8-amino-7-oxononanoate aminotransferase